jgi:hypothetical protein
VFCFPYLFLHEYQLRCLSWSIFAPESEGTGHMHCSMMQGLEEPSAPCWGNRFPITNAVTAWLGYFSWQFAGLGHWSFEISLNAKANMLGKLIYWIQACAALEILQCWFSTSHLSNLNRIQNRWYVLLPIFVFTWISIEMLVLEHLCSWKRGHGTHALQHDAGTGGTICPMPGEPVPNHEL